MTTTTLDNRASSTPALLRPSTLLLAAAIVLEVSGVRALAPADPDAAVASIDGTPTGAAAHRQRIATVAVRVVAQADLAAR